MKRFFLPCILFILVGVPTVAGAQSRDVLAGDWRATPTDLPENADPELDDSRWKAVRIPANLSEEAMGRGVVWLRKRFAIGRSENNLALVLGAVYDRDRVYLNGELIGERMGESHGYGRPRVYPLPAHVLRQGDNVLAIRIEGDFKNFIGVNYGPVAIESIPAAEELIWNRSLRSLIFASVYFATGAFFAMLFVRVGGMRDYLYYSIFVISFAVQQLMRNELRFQIADWFLFFKMTEQVLYIAVSTAFFLFFVAFFQLRLPRLAAIGYPLLNLAVALSLIAVRNPVWMDTIMTYWFLTNLPPFALYIYVSITRAMEKQTEALVMASSIIFMMLVTLHYYARERGLIHWGGNIFETGVLLFIFAISFILIFRLIRLHLNVERRRNQLDSVNHLRDRIFRYIDSILRPPASNLIALTIALQSEETTDRDRKELVGRLEGDLGILNAEMDDILELSRLEVIEEPESFENVNFNDFITAVIPQGAITSYINVDPDIEIKTSLELVNSMVIRLIDFPGFREFKHIDLIITSDLANNIHFRFLLFHNDFRQTRKLHDLITSLNPERGSLWVKWAIVREIIRILSGTMSISIINRKFLRIDIKLQAEKLQRAKRAHSTEIRVVPVFPAGVAEAETLPEAAAEIASPRLSGNMSVRDFFGYVASKFRRK
jgi:signal transduction histidine kinase